MDHQGYRELTTDMPLYRLFLPAFTSLGTTLRGSFRWLRARLSLLRKPEPSSAASSSSTAARLPRTPECLCGHLAA